MQQLRRDMFILAALLSLHSPLTAWAGEAVAARRSVEDTRGADEPKIVQLTLSVYAEPQPDEAPTPGTSVTPKAPRLAIASTYVAN